MKDIVKAHLTTRGIAYTDVGCEAETSCDYPDFAHAMAERIIATPDSRGIAICGSGIGIGIALNRHAGIRAARCRDVEDAKMSRLHNDANVLVLAGRMTEEEVAREMVDTFLATNFEGGRHAVRVEKIEIQR